MSYVLIAFLGGVAGYYSMGGTLGAFGGMIGAPLGLLMVRKVVRPLMRWVDRKLGIPHR